MKIYLKKAPLTFSLNTRAANSKYYDCVRISDDELINHLFLAQKVVFAFLQAHQVRFRNFTERPEGRGRK